VPIQDGSVKLVDENGHWLAYVDADKAMPVEGDRSRQLIYRAAGLDNIAFGLDPDLRYFYCSEDVTSDGTPLAGALHTDGCFCGQGSLSLFSVVDAQPGWGVYIDSSDALWKIVRAGDGLRLVLQTPGACLYAYQGNEPDWSRHPFPFRDLPEADSITKHAFIRGLLDYFGGTRRGKGGVIFQRPSTNDGYGEDGIPDAYFQFLGSYPYISDQRRGFWKEQIDWLGEHMHFDGCIPWGGCQSGIPYYHIWNSDNYGLFFDANGLWLDMVYRMWKCGNITPNISLVIRAADFYLHYMTVDGLVAAESKMKGCEWADLLINGWHSSLINILAYRGLRVTAEMLEYYGSPELAGRYLGFATRLRGAMNRNVAEGGLWNCNGYIDWRDVEGNIHPHYRIDTHMLSVIFGVSTTEQMNEIWQAFADHPFKESTIPAPYLLYGSWLEPVNDMLEDCTAWHGGRDTMIGRCGATLIAALRRAGKKDMAEKYLACLVNIIAASPAVYETYTVEGVPSGARSYIEHALAPLIAVTLSEN